VDGVVVSFFGDDEVLGVRLAAAAERDQVVQV
jgi:hypothetical protein